MKDFNNATMKKSLFDVYNEVNKAIYGHGVIETKIHIRDNLITFTSRHSRTPVLQAIEGDYPFFKKMVDSVVILKFKELLREALESKLGLKPASVLRDYDADTLLAMTIVILAEE